MLIRAAMNCEALTRKGAVFLLATVGCSSSSSASGSDAGRVYCVASCGTDYLTDPVDGECPSGVRTDTCPPGTCFMTPVPIACCKSGQPVAPYCDSPTSGPECPDGSAPPLTRADGGAYCP